MSAPPPCPHCTRNAGIERRLILSGCLNKEVINRYGQTAEECPVSEYEETPEEFVRCRLCKELREDITWDEYAKLTQS